MRSKSQDDAESMYDPFWVLFGDEESDEDVEPARKSGKQKLQKSRDHNEADGANIMMGLFLPEAQDTSLSRTMEEERQPRETNKKQEKQSRQKKQHYWRRPKEGGRLSFGRKTNSKRNLVVTSSDSVDSSTPPEQREMANLNSGGYEQQGRVIQDDGYSLEDNHDAFPSTALPAFMEAFGTPWDPWGEHSSSSGSSVASYSDDVSSGSSVSNESASLAAQDTQQVQQILVQFNPVADNTGTNNPKTLANQPSASPWVVIQDSFTQRRDSSRNMQAGNDEGKTSSYGRFGGSEEFQPNIEFDVIEDERKPSSCLDMQNICSVSGNKNDKKLRLPFCRSKVRDVELDLATAFPKLRMVADEKEGGLNSAAIVNSKKFKGNLPAHLQMSSDAFVSTKGPQSLYEYEYDGGEHIDVAYNHFGPNPSSLLVIRHHRSPPRPRMHGAIIQVEASTISTTDCSMRSGEWMGKDTPPLPITPGVDCVGKIYKIEKDMSSFYNLSVGDRVISLTRCGGNSRFLVIDPSQLVKIPEDVDPAEAACLAETYLSAFQVLHFAQSSGTRYKHNALKGKSILILGTVATTLGHAMVELASAAGVEKILATSTPKQFPHLRSLGIVPVSVDPALWYDQLNGKIDLVLVSNANEEVVAQHFKVLNERGHLIVIGQRVGSGLPISDWESQDHQMGVKNLVCKRNKSKSSMIDRTHDYNPFRQWELDLEKSKKDLSHLVSLLESGEIKPNVLDRIPLGKVAKAQDMVESQRHPSGFLVCEPWLRNKKRAVIL